MEVVLCPAIKTKLNVCTTFPLTHIFMLMFTRLSDKFQMPVCALLGGRPDLNAFQMLLKCAML